MDGTGRMDTSVNGALGLHIPAPGDGTVPCPAPILSNAELRRFTVVHCAVNGRAQRRLAPPEPLAPSPNGGHLSVIWLQLGCYCELLGSICGQTGNLSLNMPPYGQKFDLPAPVRDYTLIKRSVRARLNVVKTAPWQAT